MSARDRRVVASALRRATHEHHCGTPPTCAMRSGCEGDMPQDEADRLARAALAALAEAAR